MVCCSFVALVATLAALCGPVVEATLTVPPSLIQNFRDGETEALITFLRGNGKDVSTVQLIHDEVKKRVETKSKYKKEVNKAFMNGTQTLNDMMRKQMETTFSLAQASIDKQVKGFLKCESKRKKKVNSANKKLEFYKDKRIKHKACREKEKFWLDRSRKCEELIQAQKKVLQESTKMMEVFEAKNEQIFCDRTFKETDFVYAKRLRNKFKTDYETYMPKKADHEKIEKQLKRFQNVCHRVFLRLYERAKKCNRISENMDHAACKYAYRTQKACDGFSECRPLYYGSWKEAKKSAEELVKPLKPEWLVVGQTACLLKLLAKKDNKDGDKKEIAKCNDCKRGHCDKWGSDIDFREEELPKERKCKIPKEFPCNKAYFKKEYGDLPKGIHGFCHPCMGIRGGDKGEKEKGKDKKDVKNEKNKKDKQAPKVTPKPTPKPAPKPKPK